MRAILTGVFLIASFHLYSQKVIGDCPCAVKVENKFSVDRVVGGGSVREFPRRDKAGDKFFAEEHNTVWLQLNAPYHAHLKFTIRPHDILDDWDFLLYKGGTGNCSAISRGDMEPVRSNLARNDSSLSGRTGLSLEGSKAHVGPGVNPNMSSELEVEKGDSLILVVDNNRNSGKGFDLEVEFEMLEDFNVEEVTVTSSFDFVDMTEEALDDSKISINFEVLLEGTTQPIDCHAEIIGVMWSDTSLVYEDASSFQASIPRDKWFYVNVKKEGYTFGTEKYKATDEMNGTLQKIFVNPVQAGAHIVLTEIVFRENTTHLLPASVNALEQLISFMNEYPSAEIDIQGHVNAPGYDNDGKVKRLSQQRADQIKEYLVAEGIEGRRIKTTGMGNEFMVYPNPKTYEQEKANRRVEVVITAL